MLGTSGSLVRFYRADTRAACPRHLAHAPIDLPVEGGQSARMFAAARMRFLGHAVAAVAMFFVAGGHWGALQTVAWAGMLWNYSQAEGSLLSGVKKTFDGEHPCTMCDSIKSAKEKEKAKPVTVVSSKKIETFPAPLCAALPPRGCRDFVFPKAAGLNPGARRDAPPVPVPIAAIA